MTTSAVVLLAIAGLLAVLGVAFLLGFGLDVRHPHRRRDAFRWLGDAALLLAAAVVVGVLALWLRSHA